MAKSFKPAKRMGSRSKAVITLCILLAITVCLGILSVTGMKLDSAGLYKLLPWVPTNANNWPESISLGLDLQGGVYVEYEAVQEEGVEADEFEVLLQNTIVVIQNRLTEQGFTEATVTQLNDNGIRVEIPTVSDPNTVLDLIGTPAKLEFTDPDGTVVVEGADVQTAWVTKESSDTTISSDYEVGFKLTSEGATKFAEATARLIGQSISIVLDGETIMSPTVQSEITGGSGVITGSFSYDEAHNLAIQIQSGALPLTLTQQKVDTISATLGVDALQTSLLAAAIGILIVMLVLVIRYRLSGLAASWALVIYIILLFWLIAMLPGIQLTLPGIAGVILGIGMAVDANVVIFERFGEELLKGKATKPAAKAGFKNAFSAILDSNVTTLIAAFVLMAFGTGSIRGFAYMLALSVICSLITALIVSRAFLYNLIALDPDKPQLYTGKKLNRKEAQ